MKSGGSIAGLVEEDGVGTITSETARDVTEQLYIDRGLAGLQNSNAALMLQKCAALLEQANEDASGFEDALVGAGWCLEKACQSTGVGDDVRGRTSDSVGGDTPPARIDVGAYSP